MWFFYFHPIVSHFFFEKYYLYAFMMGHKKCYYFSSTSGLELAKIIYCPILEGIFNTWNRIQDNWPKHSCSSKLLFPAYYCFRTHFCVQYLLCQAKYTPVQLSTVDITWSYYASLCLSLYSLLGRCMWELKHPIIIHVIGHSQSFTQNRGPKILTVT